LSRGKNAQKNQQIFVKSAEIFYFFQFFVQKPHFSAVFALWRRKFIEILVIF
jgi:hypothetical protein